MSNLKQEITAAAAQTNLTPRIAFLLQRFFLNATTKEEEWELDDWIDEQEANEHFVDLLMYLNNEGTGAGTIALLLKLAPHPPAPPKRWKVMARRIFLGILILLVLDYLIPVHPLSWLIYGERPVDPSHAMITVASENETKTIWLSDSTRVDLLPHSSLRYPENFFVYRTIELKGSAKFDILHEDGWPFKVEGEQVWVEAYRGSFLLEQEKDGRKGLLTSLSASCTIGYDRTNKLSFAPGHRTVFNDGKLVLQPKNP